jgi:hypothetical protein
MTIPNPCSLAASEASVMLCTLHIGLDTSTLAGFFVTLGSP